MTSALFRVVNGQLVQGVEGQQTLLYATVEPKTDSAAKKLKVSWSTTPAKSGTFRWSGDTLEWSDPAVSRPQNNVRSNAHVLESHVLTSHSSLKLGLARMPRWTGKP